MLGQIRLRATQFLHWSEKFTKTDMTYLARGGFLSLLGQGANVLASLGLAIAVSHFVPKESYGIYKYVISIVSILSLFSLNSIGSAVFQSAAEGFDGALRKAFWDNIRWSVLIFLGTFALGGYYFLLGNTTLAIGVLIGGSLSPFLASVSLFNSFLGGKKDFYRQAIYGIFDSIIPIGIFIGVIFLTQNPLVLVFTYFVTNTLAGWYFYQRTITIYQASMHLHDQSMLGYSKHLSVMGIISGIASNLDQILLFHFVGAVQLAIYNFATAIPDQVKGPAKTLDRMLQARYVGRSEREIDSSVGNKVLWYFIFSASITFIYIAAAPYVYKIFFPQYLSAVFYSQIYALGILAISFDPFGTYLSAKKLVKELYVNNVVYSIFQIASMFVGVVLWGVLGLIAARIATQVVTAILNYFLYNTAVRRGNRNSIN